MHSRMLVGWAVATRHDARINGAAPVKVPVEFGRPVAVVTSGQVRAPPAAVTPHARGQRAQ